MEPIHINGSAHEPHCICICIESNAGRRTTNSSTIAQSVFPHSKRKESLFHFIRWHLVCSCRIGVLIRKCIQHTAHFTRTICVWNVAAVTCAQVFRAPFSYSNARRFDAMYYLCVRCWRVRFECCSWATRQNERVFVIVCRYALQPFDLPECVVVCCCVPNNIDNNLTDTTTTAVDYIFCTACVCLSLGFNRNASEWFSQREEMRVCIRYALSKFVGFVRLLSGRPLTCT